MTIEEVRQIEQLRYKRLDDIRQIKKEWREEGKRHGDKLRELTERMQAVQKTCDHFYTKTNIFFGPNNAPYIETRCEECNVFIKTIIEEN